MTQTLHEYYCYYYYYYYYYSISLACTEIAKCQVSRLYGNNISMITFEVQPCSLPSPVNVDIRLNPPRLPYTR